MTTPQTGHDQGGGTGTVACALGSATVLRVRSAGPGTAALRGMLRR